MENRPREKGFRRRVVAICIVVAAVMAIFVWRLGQFQLVEKGNYTPPGTSSSSSDAQTFSESTQNNA